MYTPTDSARILDAVASRVSKLETENLPSEINDALEPQGANRPASEKLPRMSQARVTERAKPLPPAVGTGGALARLVVIKELQLVPEYAPSDIRRLLELALDHQQVSRLIVYRLWWCVCNMNECRFSFQKTHSRLRGGQALTFCVDVFLGRMRSLCRRGVTTSP